ncbi:MAG: hypothetical protein L6W00_03725 [Lentisphaeria bacterium]|nr:MAG: hypothetical protein L6W00_03725 [Lentisphaeria bacterium]
MFKHGISTLLMLAAACCTAAETARLVADPSRRRLSHHPERTVDRPEALSADERGGHLLGPLRRGLALLGTQTGRIQSAIRPSGGCPAEGRTAFSADPPGGSAEIRQMALGTSGRLREIRPALCRRIRPLHTVLGGLQ